MEPLDYSIFPEKPVVYATFGQRFLAYIIDTVLMTVASFAVNWVVASLFLAFLINITIQWLYYAVQESGPNMATIGKKAMRIKVTTLYGKQITFQQATGRYFGKIISGLILLIGYFMMLWDEKCQTLHDKMAGTLVVADQ